MGTMTDALGQADRPPAREVAKELQRANRAYLRALAARQAARKKLVLAEDWLVTAKRAVTAILEDAAGATTPGAGELPTPPPTDGGGTP